MRRPGSWERPGNSNQITRGTQGDRGSCPETAGDIGDRAGNWMNLWLAVSALFLLMHAVSDCRAGACSAVCRYSGTMYLWELAVGAQRWRRKMSKSLAQAHTPCPHASCIQDLSLYLSTDLYCVPPVCAAWFQHWELQEGRK